MSHRRELTKRGIAHPFRQHPAPEADLREGLLWWTLSTCRSSVVRELIAGTILRVSQPLRLDCGTDHPAEASVLAAFGCSSTSLNALLSDLLHLAHFEAT